MKRKTYKLITALVFAVISAVFVAKGYDYLAGISASVILLLLGLSYFDGRDDKIYQEMREQMKGASLERKIELLDGKEELWFDLASAAEIEELRQDIQATPFAHPEREYLDYLLERAECYGK